MKKKQEFGAEQTIDVLLIWHLSRALKNTKKNGKFAEKLFSKTDSQFRSKLLWLFTGFSD